MIFYKEFCKSVCKWVKVGVCRKLLKQLSRHDEYLDEMSHKKITLSFSSMKHINFKMICLGHRIPSNVIINKLKIPNEKISAIYNFSALFRVPLNSNKSWQLIILSISVIS